MRARHHHGSVLNMPGVAVVTGAASGLGAAIADDLTGGVWRVAGWDLNPSAAELGVQVDVADRDEVARALEQTVGTLGEPNALVTAAGIYEMVPAGEVNDAQWERMLRVNLIGTVQACAFPGPIRRCSRAIHHGEPRRSCPPCHWPDWYDRTRSPLPSHS
jgi:NAD(P)-dependent dehydrogenase (short-subunit alcohol dehydrogenase family)